VSKNQYALKDEKGKVFFVDFESGLFSKKKVVLKNERDGVLGDVVHVGEKTGIFDAPDVTEHDIKKIKGKKITYRLQGGKEGGRITEFRTGEITDVYERVA
jgi:hypothetical protein